MKKAIIFDLDGVIVDTERTVWFSTSIELMKLYNLVYEEEKVKPLLRGSKFEDATRILYDFYHIQDTFENFLTHRKNFVLKGFAENVRFMEGFKDFYTKLGNRKKAIATSMDNEFLTLTLKHLPLQSFFDKHIYTIAQAGGKGKPHPDIFLYAAKMLNENPANCIVIEDAPKGIEAAKSAGMKAIGITTSVAKKHLTQADYIVNTFSEITEQMLS